MSPKYFAVWSVLMILSWGAIVLSHFCEDHLLGMDLAVFACVMSVFGISVSIHSLLEKNQNDDRAP